MGASEAGPPVWVWIVWLVAALAVAAVAMLRPKRSPAAPDAETPTPTPAAPRGGLDAVPLLAVTGILSFCAWVATQLTYLHFRHPTTAADGTTIGWATADLVRLSLLSAVVGWIVGFGLLVYGGGVRAVGMEIKRAPSGMLGGAIGIFVALPIVYFTLEATLTLWSALHVEHPAKHELLLAIQSDPRLWVRLAAVASAAIVAPVFEELLFRGCVQGGLRRATRSPWVSILVASLLFASIHPKWTIPPIFVFSVLLGVVYERTRNLWATTVMHALFNLFSVINSGMN